MAPSRMARRSRPPRSLLIIKSLASVLGARGTPSPASRLNCGVRGSRQRLFAAPSDPIKTYQIEFCSLSGDVTLFKQACERSVGVKRADGVAAHPGRLVDALVIAPVVVVRDKRIDLGFEVTGQIIVLEQDAVLWPRRRNERSPDTYGAGAPGLGAGQSWPGEVLASAL